jgi:hypothetical protein
VLESVRSELCSSLHDYDILSMAHHPSCNKILYRQPDERGSTCADVICSYLHVCIMKSPK